MVYSRSERPLPELPQGFTYRPVRIEDAPAASQVAQRASAAEGQRRTINPSEIVDYWQRPGSDLENYSCAVASSHGALIGLVTVDLPEIPVYPYINLTLLPDYYGHTIAEFLLLWAEKKAYKAASKSPPGTRIAFRCSATAEYAPKEKVLRDFGYTPIRYFFRMMIDLEKKGVPGEVEFPQGITLRAYKHPRDLESLMCAHAAGFKDHWGYMRESEEKERKQWEFTTGKDPLFDPDLWFLAIDTKADTIAGLCLCRIEQRGVPDTGYVQSLTVRPGYRRRGIARSLLLKSFRELYSRGKRKAALHVDSGSLTGATKLYEKVGMRRMHAAGVWEYLVREGRDLSTTKLNG